MSLWDKYTGVPTACAGQLLQETNFADDLELDLGIAMKKLRFDAEECDRQMSQLASDNHEQLTENFARLESANKVVAEKIAPLAAAVTKLYLRLEQEILQPYDDATRLHEAFKNVHAAATLLRGAGQFFIFIQQILDCEDALDALKTAEAVHLAQLHVQAHALVKDLKSVKIVRDYEPVLDRKRLDFVHEIKGKIANDLGHHSTFHEKNEHLQNYLVALHVAAPDELLQLLSHTLTKLVQVGFTLLTRALQSPRLFAQTAEEVHRLAGVFASTLGGLLERCQLLQIDQSGTLRTPFEAYLENSIGTAYHAQLAARLQKSVAATMARGGPIARNLQQHQASIIDAARATFGPPLADAVTMISSTGP